MVPARKRRLSKHDKLKRKRDAQLQAQEGETVVDESKATSTATDVKKKNVTVDAAAPRLNKVRKRARKNSAGDAIGKGSPNPAADDGTTSANVITGTGSFREGAAPRKNKKQNKNKNEIVGTVFESEGTALKKKKQKKNKKQQPNKGAPAQVIFSDEVTVIIASFEDSRSKGTLSDRLNPGHSAYDCDLKKRWKLFSKKEREAVVAADRKRLEQIASRIVSVEHPFQTTEDDHCETGVDAYKDIAPIIKMICNRIQKTEATIRIYDPYFCTGSVVNHLKDIGFENVYNKCEDFYAQIAENRIPPHDVVVTNPPYSGDHVEKLLKWCRSNGKPFFLLMPNYFCKKPYYETALGDSSDLLYLFPRKRYVYWTPKGLRARDKVQAQHSSAAGNRTSPFVSFWYIGTSPTVSADRLLAWWRKKSSLNQAATLSFLKGLPNSAMIGSDVQMRG